jgi:hypothetical protein
MSAPVGKTDVPREPGHFRSAIVERFTLLADGEFEPLVEGSTKPIASTVTHAGIVKVKRYSFNMPGWTVECPLLGEKRKTSARCEYFAF